MNEIMHTTLTSLRAFVVALRASYQLDIHGRSMRAIRRDYALAERVGKTQARLSYLVPLYNAMHAAVQQAGTGFGGGVPKYTSRFELLRARIRKVLPYMSDSDKLFEGDVLNVQILVPIAGVPIENWAAMPISALVAQVMQQVEDERKAMLNRGQLAVAARKVFVRSLTAEQRTLLAQALEVAKAAGSHAIELNVRDLDA